MPSYGFLRDLALILATTKLLGLFTKRMHLPQVVGALLAGIVFGPAVLDILHETTFLTQLSQLGVIVLMYGAGIETNLKQLKENGKTGFLVASVGVAVPLIAGWAVAVWFHVHAPGSDVAPVLQHLFIGVILTATSVSITVETLKEMGCLSTKAGNCILAAALIDDILGLICLTILSSLAGNGGAGIVVVLFKIVLFLLLSAGIGYGINKLITIYSHRKHDRHLQRFPVLGFVLCLVIAYCAETFFGVADIIGAFVAGLIVGSTPQAVYIESRTRPLTYMLLTPVFFAGIGIGIDLTGFDKTLLLFTVILVLAAVFSKLVGCGIGAKLGGMTTKQSVQVGLGMVCRGEVALIVANKGVMMGLMPANLFAPIVIMVVLTAIVTPIFLKISFADGKAELHSGDLIDRAHIVEHMDIVHQMLLEKEVQLKNDGKEK